jgi:hypothetical protein
MKEAASDYINISYTAYWQRYWILIFIKNSTYESTLISTRTAVADSTDSQKAYKTLVHIKREINTITYHDPHGQ